MDRSLIAEEEECWKRIEDNIFEEKYFLGEAVIDCLINE
jgi:hypothetical protein